MFDFSLYFIWAMVQGLKIHAKQFFFFFFLFGHGLGYELGLEVAWLGEARKGLNMQI